MSLVEESTQAGPYKHRQWQRTKNLEAPTRPGQVERKITDLSGHRRCHGSTVGLGHLPVSLTQLLKMHIPPLALERLQKLQLLGCVKVDNLRHRVVALLQLLH